MITVCIVQLNGFITILVDQPLLILTFSIYITDNIFVNTQSILKILARTEYNGLYQELYIKFLVICLTISCLTIFNVIC